MCLLSPQQMAQHTASSSDGFICRGAYTTLTFLGFQRTIPCSSLNNLPIFFFTMDPSSTNTNYHPFASLLSSTSASSDTSTNLSSVKKKLLHMHQKLGHLNIPAVQNLARSGAFGSSLKSISNCEVPLCRA